MAGMRPAQEPMITPNTVNRTGSAYCWACAIDRVRTMARTVLVVREGVCIRVLCSWGFKAKTPTISSWRSETDREQFYADRIDFALPRGKKFLSICKRAPKRCAI